MKKIISVFLIFVSVLAMTACSSGPTLTMNKFPWTRNDVFHYERTVYEITRKNAAGNTIAAGELTYTLDAVPGEDYFKLEMQFDLLFTENNKSDSISSTSYFSQYRLTPVRTVKSMRLENTIDYEMFKVGPESNYDFEGTYIDATVDGKAYTAGASGTFGIGDSSEYTADMKMSKKDFPSTDNEYVYYFIRGIEELNTGYSVTFGLYNIYDSLNLPSPSLSKTTMSLSVASDTAEFAVDQSLVSPAGGLTQFSGSGDAVTALKATLGISGQRSGAATTLYYSKPGSDTTSIALNNRKVLLGMEIPERSPNDGRTLYTNYYKLKEYASTK